MATVPGFVKGRLLAILVCGALVLGAFTVVAVASPPPSIDVDPHQVTSANCSNVTVSGQNFVGGGNVASLFVDGTFQGAADVAPDGTFNISFNACSLAPGKHIAVVSSTDGTSALKHFEVK